MHTIDTRRLPVLVVHTVEPMTLQDVQAMLAAAEQLIARQERFALVMATDGGDNKKRERGVNAAMTGWIKAHKPFFAQYCAGVASVVPTSALLALYKPMVKVSGPRLYGCPVEIFSSLEEALAWAEARLAGG